MSKKIQIKRVKDCEDYHKVTGFFEENKDKIRYAELPGNSHVKAWDLENPTNTLTFVKPHGGKKEISIGVASQILRFLRNTGLISIAISLIWVGIKVFSQ